MCIVSVNQVEKFFPMGSFEVKALQSVSLEVQEGDFLALVGPSGSGKTTLLNLIGALDLPTKGDISIQNQNLSSLAEEELAELRLKKLGFVFQAYNLIPVLTAFENVEFPLILQGIAPKERKERVEHVFTQVHLQEQMHKRPNEMSGGQQQRVAVARALVSKPKLILADEPTANLDSKTGADLLDLMKELNQIEKVTFVFSTHDSLVMERASRLVHLRDGKIISEEMQSIGM